MRNKLEFYKYYRPTWFLKTFTLILLTPVLENLMAVFDCSEVTFIEGKVWKRNDFGTQNFTVGKVQLPLNFTEKSFNRKDTGLQCLLSNGAVQPMQVILIGAFILIFVIFCPLYLMCTNPLIYTTEFIAGATRIALLIMAKDVFTTNNGWKVAIATIAVCV